jgi:3',5'-cyclic AMP phosphodiesterase CpdA
MMIRFFAIADFGNPSLRVKGVAEAMNKYALSKSAPEFIFGLGDNFYPDGVTSVDDEKFQTHWADVFLPYESLRVPWKMILGNHDYIANPTAQIDYHYSSLNQGKLWHMPAKCYNFTASSRETAADATTAVFEAEFFGVDTNGVQLHVREVCPGIENDLRDHLVTLRSDLGSSMARWKLVFGHHPLYTQGRGHSTVASCLRQQQYSFRRAHSNIEGVYSRDSKDPDVLTAAGYGMEDTLVAGGAHVYLCGHEHVFQYHCAPKPSIGVTAEAAEVRVPPTHAVHHIGCGATGALDDRGSTSLYRGWNDSFSMDWAGGGEDVGFVAVEISHSEMLVRFVSLLGEIIKEVRIAHPSAKG